MAFRFFGNLRSLAPFPPADRRRSSTAPTQQPDCQNMNCPHCQQPIRKFKLNLTTSMSPGASGFNVVAHSCESCDAVISIEVDPIAIREDIKKASLLQKDSDSVTV